MWLKKFSVVQLHGMLDLEIKFNRDLTVIVGRNGAGKTSALNLISDILRLNRKGLLATQFVRAELCLGSSDNGTVEITVDRESETPTIDIQAPGFSIGRMPLSLIPDPGPTGTWLSHNFYVPDLAPRFDITIPSNGLLNLDPNWGRNFRTIEEWRVKAEKFIKEEVRLTFVRLDRTILAIDPSGNLSVDEGETVRGAKQNRQSDRKYPDPIEVVKDVTRRKFFAFKSAQERIKSAAVEKLLRLHFQESSSSSKPEKPRKPTARQLETQIVDLQQKVSTSSLVQGSPGLAEPVEKFFKETRRLLDLSFKTKEPGNKRKSKAEIELESILFSRQERIQQLLEIFEEEQSQTASAYAQLQTYLDVAQEFFKDSGKELVFDPKTFELAFRIKINDVTVNAEDSTRSIGELSSGEKQILIVLTYLAFMANDQSIFVVDEPELSLHLRWQASLVSAITKLRPQGCQIILATHAPEIAGRVKESCFILTPVHLQS